MNTKSTRVTGPHLRPSKAIIVLVGIIFAFLTICGGTYYYLTEWPQYIELSVPHPGKGDWSFTQKTVQVWTDSGDKFFIWQRKTMVMVGCCGEFRDWDAIVGYFDEWFRTRGWDRAEKQGDGPCSVYMAESDFLKIGRDGYVVYKPHGSQVYQWVPTACLAAWPTGTGNSYNVVLLTANPSPLTAILQGFEY